MSSTYGSYSSHHTTGEVRYLKDDHVPECVIGSVMVDEMDGVRSHPVFYDPEDKRVVSVPVYPDSDSCELRYIGPENVDQDSLMDAYAAKVAIADSDPNSSNIIVSECGEAAPIDFGICTSIEHAYDYAARRLCRDWSDIMVSDEKYLVECGSKRDLLEELGTRAVEKAASVDLDSVIQRVANRPSLDNGGEAADILGIRCDEVKRAASGDCKFEELAEGLLEDGILARGTSDRAMGL